MKKIFHSAAVCMVTALLLVMPLQAQAATAETEPNDSIDSANVLSLPGTSSRNGAATADGNISSSSDVDWWKIELPWASMFTTLTVQNIEVIGAQYEVYEYGQKIAGPMTGSYSITSKYGKDMTIKVTNATPGTYQVNSSFWRMLKFG
ncbi:hypothetical protein ACP26L_10200 [Paenibacillus sp. S-38]|uniref:hypothetical protein n=1 Tax=Paenibacillus sp. S-38 TaxID=3416710 RepID=UPI003CE6BDF1